MRPRTEQWEFLHGHIGVHREAGPPHFLSQFTRVGDPAWLYRVEIGEGGEVQRFEVVARNETTPPGGITTRMLHGVPLGALASEAKARLAATHKRREALTPQPSGLAELVGSLARRPGRRGRTDLDYALIAAAYAAKVERGDPTPIESLTEELHLSASHLRNLLYEARARGLLTPAAPGRAGGSLTDKARRLVEADRGER